MTISSAGLRQARDQRRPPSEVAAEVVAAAQRG
jgi:hypothetical protein